ncbi:cobalamin biosynthesis protein [Microvirga sp. KLBC 81]|uniref:cobalamin biosynthesis protein n=1 Tax=Microvirga sp. KLBC 81 TaxID=1862707 RepID=UPI001FE1406E|nr:cobalamin biosynthesis protein [Microvirga sp. KLBC 81]
MIVAGVGFRRNVDADEIVALVEQALARAAVAREALDQLATVEALAALSAFSEAARRLAVTPISVAEQVLIAAAPRGSTHSARSMVAHGVGSVAEAAALAAGGPQSELILERIASASATCALARREIRS